MTLQDGSPATQIWQRKLDALEFPVGQTHPAKGPANAPLDHPSAADSRRHPRPATVQFLLLSDAALLPSHHPADGPLARVGKPNPNHTYRAAARAGRASTPPWRKS